MLMFCSFGPVLLVIWHAFAPGHQEDNKRTRRERQPRRRAEGGQEEARRRVDARRRLPTTVGRQPRRRSIDDIEEASTASVPEYEPCCEYERIRDQIKGDCERMYETTFGVPYPRGQQSGMLEQILLQ